MKQIIILIIVVLCCKLSNSQVTQEWVKTFPGYGSFQSGGNSIAADNSGFIYVTGFSKKLGNGTGYDIITIKYGSNGQSQWVKRFAEETFNSAHSICVDEGGNAYVTGRSGSQIYKFDFCTIKYNSQGVQQWMHTYNGPGNKTDEAISSAIDGLGNVYVTGRSKGISNGNSYATIKYDSEGTVVWARRYDGPGSEDFATSLAVDGAGNVYVTGGSSETVWDYATIKYNSAGTQLWVQRYNSPGNWFDYATALVIDDSANVYVTGQSWTSMANSDYVTIKYNSSGIQQWLRSYSGMGNGKDYPSSIALDGSANIYVTGWSRGIGTRLDYQTIKYNSQGVTQWSKRYNGSGPGLGGDDYAYGIAVDASGNVYVTGASKVLEGHYDFVTIKYSQSLDLPLMQNPGSNNDIPTEFKLYDNFPNPFNPLTKIRFDIPVSLSGAKDLIVKLVIYDLLGREVSVLINNEIK